jgi:hypothetical protein
MLSSLAIRLFQSRVQANHLTKMPDRIVFVSGAGHTL